MKQAKRILAVTLVLLMLVTPAFAFSKADSGAVAATSGPIGETRGTITDENGNVLPASLWTPYSDLPEGTPLEETLEIAFVPDQLAALGAHSVAGGSTTSNTAYRMFMDCLVMKDAETGEIVPMLAESWENVDDTEFTFHLRQDVKFHNGEPLTADDVIFTIYGSQEWGEGAASYDLWNQVDTYEALDDYTVHLTLKQKNVEWFPKLFTTHCGIVNREAVEADNVEGYWIGTGAYKIIEFVPKDHVTFERNDDYWGEKPLTKYQIWRICADTSTRAAMLATHQIDGIGASISDSDKELFKTDPVIVYPQTQSNYPSCLIWNLKDPLMGDKNFRLACAHAINRDDVAIVCCGEGSYTPVDDGTIWSGVMPFRNTDLPMHEYDPELAKEYLAKTDYHGEEIELLTAPFLTDYVAGAEVIQQQLAEVGINVKIRQTDNAGINALFATPESRDDETQMIFWTHTLISEETSQLRPVFYTDAPRNLQNISDPELDALMDEDAVTNPNDPRKEEICMRIQEIIYDYLPCINMYYPRNTFAFKNTVGGAIYYTVSLDWRYAYRVAVD